MYYQQAVGGLTKKRRFFTQRQKSQQARAQGL
jgi:hypothetical protein